MEDECCCYACPPMERDYDDDCEFSPQEYCLRNDDFDDLNDKEEIKKVVKKEVKKEEVKKVLNFDELIISQDSLDGNWESNEETKLLIEEENAIYEKIKKYSEDKGIKEENGMITILVLYYIYNKKTSKVEELKFVINKAKAYVKKIYGVEYEEISKEI